MIDNGVHYFDIYSEFFGDFEIYMFLYVMYVQIYYSCFFRV